MVTTTTISITDDNTYYYTPDDFEGANGLTQAATVAGANDGLVLYYGSNDTVLVTGSADYVTDEGDHGLINAQSAAAAGDFYVYGPGSTVLGSSGNDFIVSYGEHEEIGNGTTVTVGPGSQTYSNSETLVIGNYLYGEAGDDTIYGYSGDTAYGGQGNDVIGIEAYGITTPTGHGPGTFVSGDAGNDIIAVSYEGYSSSIPAGYDTVYGGAGDDTIYASTSGYTSSHLVHEQLYGQAGNDVIVSSGDYATIYGGQGNDHIVLANIIDNDGVYSADTVAGGYGFNDFISGDDGNDLIDAHLSTSGGLTVFGGTGDDTIYGDTGGGDQLYGQSGNDTIYLNSQGTIYGGAGNDLLSDNAHGGSFMSGDNGDDSIFASGAGDTVYGGDGNDSILATAGDEQLYGQSGNDIITFDAGGSTLGGGTAEAATIYGGAGDDFITVSFHTMESTSATETLNPGGSNDLYDPYTGAVIGGNDVVSYSYVEANDGVGFHFLSGDLGNDTIIGGSGGDTFVGGEGSDLLVSHRLTATGNDPSAPGYQDNGAGSAAASDAGSATNPEDTPTTPSSTHTVQHSPEPTGPETNLADTFIFSQNDSVAGNPVAPGTGSDVSTGGGEAGLDHIQGFLLNVSGQEATFANTTGAAETSFVNSQTGDNLVFLGETGQTGHTTAGTALDTNVFYGTVDNVVTGTSVATEQSDYAVAYAYAFGTGGTAAAPTASAHFAAAVDFIVVDVVDTGSATVNNGNIFVFDHNGNGVALDGAGLQSAGTTGSFQDSASPTGGLVDGTDALGNPLSVTSVNIYH